MRIFELAITWTGIGNTLLGLLSFIIILGIIVMIHEGGHFFFAKKAGILCYEFSIGMGPIWGNAFLHKTFPNWWICFNGRRRSK